MKQFLLSIVILGMNMRQLSAQQLEWQTINHPLLNGSEIIWCLETDASDNLWVGTNQSGILKYSNGSWTEFISSNSILPDNTINDLCWYDNAMWAATSTGIAKIEGQFMENFTTVNAPLPVLSPSCIAADRSGNIWFGQNSCSGGEVIAIRNSIWQRYDYSNSPIPQQAWIRCLCVDLMNNIWIGTYSHGLFKFDGINWFSFNVSNSDIPGDLVKSLAARNDGTIIVGTYSGVAAFDGVNWTLIDGHQTNTIEVSHSGEAWIGFDASMIGVYNLEANEHFNTINSGLTSDFIYAITSGNNGSVWFACYPISLVKYGLNSITTEVTDAGPGQHSMHVYPNPFRDQLIVEAAGAGQLIWMNLLGDVMNVTCMKSGSNLIYDTALLPEGIYFLINMEKNQSYKLIKMH